MNRMSKENNTVKSSAQNHEHSGAFVTIMYVRVTIQIKKQSNKIMNTDNLNSYTFPVKLNN